MREVLEFWAGKGVDGFRCDMASMVPLKFWNWAITSIKERYSDILFIAEIYEKRLYDQFLNIGKFDYLYDKVGLYDTLRSVTEGKSDASEITACWSSLNGVEDKMLNFLENHDEQRIASDFFAGDPFRAIPALTVVLMLNRAPFLIYFGQELGERGMEAEGFSGMDGKTTIFDYWSVSTVRSWIESGELPDIGTVYKKLINIALTENSISSGLKYDLMYANRDSSEFEYRYIYSFIRKADDSLLLILVNFSQTPERVSLRVPIEAFTHLNIKPEYLHGGVDILSESEDKYELSHETKTEINLKGFGVKIIKFLL
jgi:glycosidase